VNAGYSVIYTLRGGFQYVTDKGNVPIYEREEETPGNAKLDAYKEMLSQRLGGRAKTPGKSKRPKVKMGQSV
jgi:hypothetical protein